MREQITKDEVIGFLLIMLMMLSVLTYNYFQWQQTRQENCWSQYQTENEAILNCEGINK